MNKVSLFLLFACIISFNNTTFIATESSSEYKAQLELLKTDEYKAQLELLKTELKTAEKNASWQALGTNLWALYTIALATYAISLTPFDKQDTPNDDQELVPLEKNPLLIYSMSAMCAYACICSHIEQSYLQKKIQLLLQSIYNLQIAHETNTRRSHE